jgi:hypothetical protein
MKNISGEYLTASPRLTGIMIDQNASKAVSFALCYNSSLQVIYIDIAPPVCFATSHWQDIVSNRTSFFGESWQDFISLVSLALLPECCFVSDLFTDLSCLSCLFPSHRNFGVCRDYAEWTNDQRLVSSTW